MWKMPREKNLFNFRAIVGSMVLLFLFICEAYASIDYLRPSMMEKDSYEDIRHEMGQFVSLQNLISISPTIEEVARDPSKMWRKWRNGTYSLLFASEWFGQGRYSPHTRVLWEHGEVALIYVESEKVSENAFIYFIIGGWFASPAVSIELVGEDLNIYSERSSSPSEVNIIRYFLCSSLTKDMPLREDIIETLGWDVLSPEEQIEAQERFVRDRGAVNKRLFADNAIHLFAPRKVEPERLNLKETDLISLIQETHHGILWERLILLPEDGNWWLIDGELLGVDDQGKIKSRPVVRIHNHTLLLSGDARGPSGGKGGGDYGTFFTDCRKGDAFYVLVDWGGAYKVTLADGKPTGEGHIIIEGVRQFALDESSRVWLHDLDTDKWAQVDYVSEERYQLLLSQYGIQLFSDPTVDWLQSIYIDFGVEDVVGDTQRLEENL